MILKQNQDILRVPLNTRGKDYIVGDIHGEYSKLISKLKSVGFDFHNDRLFSVGDFVDRGKESIKCYLLLYKDWFFASRGNHEDMLAEYKHQGFIDRYAARCVGASWFLDIENIDMMYDIACTLDMLPYVIELDTPRGKIGIVHASPLGYDWNRLISCIEEEKGRQLFRSQKENCIWDRTFYKMCDIALYKDKSIEGIDYIVTGHNHCSAPKIVNNFYSIATIDYEENSEFEFLLLDTSTMELI